MISPNNSLLLFLRDSLAIPEESIESALQHSEQDLSLFPIILWQYKLITLEQLDQIFDWLATTYANKDTDTVLSQQFMPE
ncbi:MAG: DUF2949 domain-containing protein [Cyanobacteria bacterium P01_B01_bin.77]